MPEVNNENQAPPRFGTQSSESSSTGGPQKRTCSALELGPRKKQKRVDPLVHHGRHFGRTVFAFANVHALILAGLSSSEEPPETQQTRRELRVFRKLLQLIPGLEGRLASPEVTEEDVMDIAELIQQGASGARTDDTKGLKGAIIEWLTPPDGVLAPSLNRNQKSTRGFNHPRTGFLLCPTGMDWADLEQRQLRDKEIRVPGSHWPLFVFENETYDPAEPWKGLWRGSLLLKGFRHIFTSPSSVDKDPKATKSGNAKIHGMTSVTPASIAYVATQVRFALSSASVFCRTDQETDSETFYTSALELLEDPEEQGEVQELMTWWNSQIFPSFSNPQKPIPANSAYSKIKERRAALNALAASSNASPDPGA